MSHTPIHESNLPAVKTCAQCGRDLVRAMFPARQAFERARFCNWSCYKAAKPGQLSMACAHCGVVFQAKANRVRKAEAKYCTPQCRGAHHHARVADERLSTGRRCPVCDAIKPIAEFHRHRTNGVCSYCGACANARARRMQATKREPDWAAVRARLRGLVTITDAGCWEVATSRRYSQIGVRGAMWLGHRLSYRAFVGEIPNGLQLDHLCMNKRCVNPEHLEAVTPLENTRRYLAHVRQSTSQPSPLC